MDIREIAEELDREDLVKNVTYIESEGDDRVRLDYSNEASIWLNSDGSVEGLPARNKAARKFLQEKGFKYFN